MPLSPRSLRSSILLAALLALASGEAARGAPIVDQSHDPSVVNFAAVAFLRIAQTFTVGRAGTLDAVEVDLLVAFDDPLTVTAQIVRTLGGVPTFDALASVVVPVAAAEAGIERVSPRVDFTAFRIEVAPGDVLALYLTVPGSSSFINWLGSRRMDADYAGGMAWVYDSGASGVWESFPRTDLGFRTLVTIPEPTTALAVLGGTLVLAITRRRA